jgi:uncharacterized protein YndB with AHSA1/START domain
MMTVKHTTFALERTYAASPDVVFAAWSDSETKAKWYAAADDRYTLEFRVGGTEVVRGRKNDGVELLARSQYHDIVANERIVYTTALFSGDELSTVSLTTVQLAADGDGTQLSLIEQDTFLDDKEQPEWREQGTGDWLDALGRLVGRR